MSAPPGQAELQKLMREETGAYSRTTAINMLRSHHEKCVGIKKELVDAIRQYRLDAERGDAESQYLLGCCYQFGDGIAPNRTEAGKWLQLSARQGYPQAQTLLKLIKRNKNNFRNK